MIELEFHPLCELFPKLTGDAFDDLAADIKLNGQMEPISVYQGKILDGRNRYLACKASGVEPNCVKVTPADPVSFVISRNLSRRHLTVGQRALLAAKLKETLPAIAVKKMGKQKRDSAGKAVGVSGRSVDAASGVLKSGIPELIKAVEQGKIAISAANAIAGLPAAEQKATVNEYLNKKAEGKKGGKKSGKAKTGKAKASKKSKPAHESRTLRALKVLWLRADNTERADFLLWTKDHTK